jgi:RHS repeat-associated protein
MYVPNLGRFLTRDPAGYVDGMSLYEYVRGRVPNAVDPSGLCTIWLACDPVGIQA